jgi:Zn-finger nucleic acid-binding protein
MCGEEALQYKYDDRGKVHIMYCTECKSVWYSRTEDEAKRQHNGGAKKT